MPPLGVVSVTLGIASTIDLTKPSALLLTRFPPKLRELAPILPSSGNAPLRECCRSASRRLIPAEPRIWRRDVDLFPLLGPLL